MLINIWILTLGTLIAFALYWSLPPQRAAQRQAVLITVSAVLVLLYSVGGFFACLYLALVPLVAQRLYARRKGAVMFWLGIAFALLPLVGFRLFSEPSFYLTFGIAFATVKSVGLTMLAYSGRMALRLRDVLLMIFFFPLFTVGPVERLVTFAKDNFASRFSAADMCYGLYRIWIGLFLTMFVCEDILSGIRDTWYGRSTEDIAAFSRLDAFGLVGVSFLYTYLNFEGFSAIAIGLSRLFGLKVVENFDRPLMISNIAEFWKRYHISMGNWINQFIFLPLVLWFKTPWASYASTIIAFVLFGLWHAFTLNYIVWGLANGIGVALVHYGTAQKVLPLAKGRPGMRWLVAPLGGAVSLLYVAWAQTFANLSSFGDALLLTSKLLFG